MKTLLLACSLLLLPIPAYAFGCDCGSVQNMITLSQTQIIQEVNANTTEEAKSTPASDRH